MCHGITASNKYFYTALTFLLLLVVFNFYSCGSSGDDNPVGPGSKIETGNFRKIVTEYIGSEGGKVVYSNTADSLNGLTLEVPYSSYQTAKTYEISVAPLTKNDYGADFIPLTPVIRISNGGGYSDSIMTLEVPINLPEGYFPMAFYFDGETGELEGIPAGAVTKDNIYIGSRHFDGKKLSDGKTTVIQGTQTYADLIVAAIKLDDLNGFYDSKYTPGKDDWEFTNWGSYIDHSGFCAGSTLSAMWYYSVRKLKEGKSQLYGAYDQAGSIAPPDRMWQDNPKGIRLASMVQADYIHEFNAHNRQNNWMDKFAKIGLKKFSRDSLSYLSFLYALKMTGKPQITAIWTADASIGHAMVVNKGGNGVLHIADPNYPGITDRTIEFINGNFKPYNSGSDAAHLGSSFTDIEYFAKTAFVDFAQIEKRWKEFDENTIGNGTFPGISFQYKDDKGNWQDLPDLLKANTETVAIRAICPTCAFTFTDQKTALYVLNEKGDTLNDDSSPTFPEVSINTKDYANQKLGLLVTGKSANNAPRSFINFKWFTLSGEPQLTILPADPNGIPVNKAGEINKEYTFKLNTSGTLKNILKIVWDFGDGSGQTTKTGDTTVKHTFTSNGAFNILAKVYDNATSIQLGEARATASIGSNVSISSFSPASGPDGQVITINGTGFGNNESGNGYVCLFLQGSSYRALYSVSWSNNKIQAIVNTESNMTGRMDIKVRLYNPDKLEYTWSNPISFEVVNCAINSIKPDSLVTDSIMTISGSGFGEKSSLDSISFNGDAVKSKQIISWTNNEIKCVIPRLPTGQTTIRINKAEESYEYGNRLVCKATPAFIFDYLKRSVTALQSAFSRFTCNYSGTMTHYDANGKPKGTSPITTTAAVYLYPDGSVPAISINGHTFKIQFTVSSSGDLVECTGTISGDGRVLTEAEITRKSSSGKIFRRIKLSNIPLKSVDYSDKNYNWEYSITGSGLESYLTEYYEAFYDNTGKLTSDIKASSATEIMLILNGNLK